MLGNLEQNVLTALIRGCPGGLHSLEVRYPGYLCAVGQELLQPLA
jgi:hypothetical protein